MSAKLSRLLCSPFRLRQGEVSVEVVTLPCHLSSGVLQEEKWVAQGRASDTDMQ